MLCRIYPGLLLLLLLVAMGLSQASQFRRLQPILPVAATAKPKPIPKGFKPVKSIRPISSALMQQAVTSVLSRWNRSDFDQALSSDFPRRQELLDNLSADVANDARLRLLNLQNPQIQAQFAKVDGKVRETLSQVLVNARVQLDLAGAASGPAKHNSSLELRLSITTREAIQ